ncbi:MAG: GNAT family N-acetyltransferase, partial [Clostridia bacterium]|nr:GNAT family N-acetyltransferase [Clostridia bacterium]
MMIETERLILRPWRDGDAEVLYKYASDPDVGTPAGWLPHESVEHSLEIIRTILSAKEVFAVCLKSDGKPVGNIHLNFSTDMTDLDDECELGYWLGKPYWGRGIIPEAGRAVLRRAFAELGVNAVWCGRYDGNEKSHRVQQKLGFVYHHTTHGLHVAGVNEIRT